MEKNQVLLIPSFGLIAHFIAHTFQKSIDILDWNEFLYNYIVVPHTERGYD